MRISICVRKMITGMTINRRKSEVSGHVKNTWLVAKNIRHIFLKYKALILKISALYFLPFKSLNHNNLQKLREKL